MALITFTRLWNHSTSISRTFSFYQRETTYIKHKFSIHLSPQPLRTSLPLSASMNVPVLNVFLKWKHTIFVLLCLTFSLINVFFSHSVQFSCLVVSDSLGPHELQYARPPCPSPTPGVHSNSCPSSRRCHPAISSSVIPFSSCPQSLPASESFPISQLFSWGGQSTGLSHSVMSKSLWSHGLQHARVIYPSLSPRLCSNSSILSWRCHQTIPFSVTPFYSCPQSFPESGFFPMSWLFLSGSKSMGASTSASVPLVNIQYWVFSRIDWFDLLAAQGTLKCVLQHHSSKSSIFRHSAFFMVHPYMTTGKTIALTDGLLLAK